MKLPSLHQQLDSCPLPVSTWRAHSLPCLSNQWVCAEETNVPARYGRRLNKCVQEWAPTTGRRSALHLVATIVVCCEDFLRFFLCVRAFAEPLIVSLDVRKRCRKSGQWRAMFPTVPVSDSDALLDVSRSWTNCNWCLNFRWQFCWFKMVNCSKVFRSVSRHGFD